MAAQNILVPGNNSTTALTGAGTFTGTFTDLTWYSDVLVAVKSDQDGTLYVDFSPEGTNTDSTLTYAIAAGVNEVHRLRITRPFARIRYVNGSVAQTYMRLQMLASTESSMLSSPLNLPVQQDADASVVRSVDSEIMISTGLFSGFSITNKFGRNPDIDTATVPEDIWNGGGAYTGFPTGSAETVTVVSSSANDAAAGSGARTIRIEGLDADYEYQSEDLTLNGTTRVTSVNTWTRVNRMRVLTSGSSNQAFNAGTITCAHSTTTANVFAAMPIGFNRTPIACYTIPAGYTGYLRKFTVAMDKATAATISGAIWFREFGYSPELLRPFSVSNSEAYTDEIYGGFVLQSKTDVALRITACSTNNVVVDGLFDLILVKN